MLKGKGSHKIIKRGKLSKKIKKDYQSKSLNNPFFRSRNKNKGDKKNKKKYFYISIFFIFFVATIYIIFFSNIFKINNITINGLERLNSVDVQNYIQEKQDVNRLIFLSQDNLLFINTKDLASDIQKDFKLANASVDKKFFHSLEINLRERPIAFIWQDDDMRSFSDAIGCLITDALVTPDTQANLAILESESDLDYLKDDGCLDLDEEYFTALFNLNRELVSYPSLLVDKFIVSSELNSLVVDLNKGPNIIFNIKEDMLKQINKLLIIQQEQEEEQFLSLQYIDLRFGDLIYFK